MCQSYVGIEIGTVVLLRLLVLQIGDCFASVYLPGPRF